MHVRTCLFPIALVTVAVFAHCAALKCARAGENGFVDLAALDDPAISIDAGWSATVDTPPAFFWTGGLGAFNQEGPFTFFTEETVVLCVTDDFCPGDVFRIYDYGFAIGDTSAPDGSEGDCANGVGPDAAATDPAYSTGAWLLGPGHHAITIQVIAGLGGGRGYLRVDSLDHFPDFCTPVAAAGPYADAGPDQSVRCMSEDGAVVTLRGSGFDPDGDALSFTWDVPDGIVLDDPNLPTTTGLFPLGVTEATLTVTDGEGGVAVDTVRITVIDRTPPEVACVTDLAALHPANHKMVEVGVFVDATDACTAPEDLVLLEVNVSSDEPDDAEGNGDGDTLGDTEGQDGFAAPVVVTKYFRFNPTTASFEGSVFLRAECDGGGDGRSYTIEAIVLDTQGNPAFASCVVVVPHDSSSN